jgi:PTH1 family peptidyl-tRNA hydrolase
MVIDLLSHRWPGVSFQNKFQSECAVTDFKGSRVILIKPQTYMNLSGKAALEASQFYKVSLDRVIVLTDDLDTETGQLRLRLKGGSAGHNGIKSVIEVFGSEDFPRIRLGIGRSAVIPADEYVLGRISKQEEETYQEMISTAADAVETIIIDGFLKAMNTFNKKVTP